MSASNFVNQEPLYIIMVRQPGAEDRLKQWAAKFSGQVTIENNRMKLYDQRSFDNFYLNWPYAWHDVTIWDCWNRRHIYPNL